MGSDIGRWTATKKARGAQYQPCSGSHRNPQWPALQGTLAPSATEDLDSRTPHSFHSRGPHSGHRHGLQQPMRRGTPVTFPIEATKSSPLWTPAVYHPPPERSGHRASPEHRVPTPRNVSIRRARELQLLCMNRSTLQILGSRRMPQL